MTQTPKIAPAVPFDPEMTKEHARPPFVLLANDPGLRACDTLRKQVLFAHDFLSQQRFQLFSITNAEIARFFGVHDHVVWDIIKRGDNGDEQRGRFPRVDEIDYRDLRCWIDAAIQEHNPLTLADAVEKWQSLNHKRLTKNALQKALTKAGIAKTIIAHPEDAGRLDMSYQELARYITEAAVLTDVPSEFVFNIDETGINERANAKAKKVLVDFHSNETSTKYPAPRGTRHATLVACIAADGTATKPLVIIQQVTIRQRLITEGWTPRKAIIEHSESGYINQHIFLRWINLVFIPDVERRSEDLAMPLQQAYLVMDNCSAHLDDEVRRVLEEHNIFPVFIPAHGSHIFQPLDQSPFASFKNMFRSATTIDADSQTVRLLKILESWERAASMKTIIGSFRLAGFRFTTREYINFVLFHINSVDLPQGFELTVADQPRPPRARPSVPSGPRLPIV